MTAAGDRRLASACLMGSFEGTEPPPWLLRTVRDGLGGVLLFAQNVVDDAQVAELCTQLRDARADVVIAIDEEGGDVTRLDAARGSDTPCPAAFGFVDDVTLTTDAYTDLGHRVRSVGIDLTLAPCADINSNPRNPIIGVRSFGTTPAVVARHVVAAIDGFHRGGVSVCAKHFPGHGDTSDDTHLGGARLSAAMTTLEQRELVPFAASIEAGADAILTAHIVAVALDDAPVSVSAEWTEHLRETMGFDGVIITDALDMEALAGGRGIEGIADAAVLGLHAGADFLCLGSNFDETMTNAVIDRVACALDDARLQRTHLDRSRRRIAMLRRPAAAPWPTADPELSAARIVAERAIVVDGELPDGPFAVVECRPPGNMACFNVTWGLADSLRDRRWPTVTITASDPIEPACAAAAAVAVAGDLPILVAVRDSCVHPWQTAVIDALVRARPGAVTVVELGWPGRRPTGAVAHVVSHGAARSSTDAVINRLATPTSDVREP